MSKVFTILFIFILLFSFNLSLSAINDSASHTVTMQVNEVALIDLNSTAGITLTTSAPSQGGESVTGDTDSSKLLQYTSLVSTGTTRNITVNWGAGDSAPAGTSLKLEATTVPANCGTAGGQLTISNTAQSLLTNIGSCATGIGANGSEMTYTFSVDDATSLNVGDNQTVTITFTLTDAS